MPVHRRTFLPSTLLLLGACAGASHVPSPSPLTTREGVDARLAAVTTQQDSLRRAAQLDSLRRDAQARLAAAPRLDTTPILTEAPVARLGQPVAAPAMPVVTPRLDTTPVVAQKRPAPVAPPAAVIPEPVSHPVAAPASVPVGVPVAVAAAPVTRRDSVVTLTTRKRQTGKAVPQTVMTYRERRDIDSVAARVMSERMPPWITVGEGAPNVNVSFYSDELADVLSLFSRVSNVSIITSDEKEVQDKIVTAEISDKPWNLALELLLRAHGLHAYQDQETGIITVQTEARSLALRMPEIIRLRYVNADDIIQTLKQVIGADQQGAGQGSQSSGRAPDVIEAVKTGSEKSRTLMVYTSPEKLAKIRQMVEKLDRKRPTVTIQARLVFINRSRLEQLGFTYNISPRLPNQPGTGTGTGTGTGVPGTPGTVNPLQPGAQIAPFGQQGFGGVGQQGFGFGQQQQSNPAISILTRLALSGTTDLNLFFNVLASNGLAEVEAAPVVTTTSDLQAEINVGEFFILPNINPILAASTVQQPFGQFPGQMGQFPGQMGQFPGQMGQFPGQMGQFPGQMGGQFPGQMGGQVPGQMGGVGGIGGVGQGGFGGAGGFAGFQTGTQLQVTPYVLPNGKVRMALSIQRDGGTLGADGRTITGPRQSSKTEVIVDDQEMIVIGGLTVVSKTTTNSGVPILQDLPIIGGLFRSKQQAQVFQDLVIVVQPKILDFEDDETDTSRGALAPLNTRPRAGTVPPVVPPVRRP